MKPDRLTRIGALLAALAVLLVLSACAQAPAAPAAPPAAPTTAPAAAQPAAPKATDAPKAAAPAAPTAAAAAPTVAAAAAPKATDAPKAAAPAAGAGASTYPASATRGSGNPLKILYWQAPTILNPHLAQGTKDFHAAQLVLEPLAYIGADGKPFPVLASEVPTLQNGGVSADGKTITWKLKPGIKWSDGSDFTAEDVVFTSQYVADPKTASTNASIMKGVEKVEAVDPLTVKITFTAPNPYPYQAFTNELGLILQKKQFADYMGEKAKDAPGNLKPIGTGPYVVTDFKPGDVVTYAPNSAYREANKPFFKEVQIKGGGDATSAARAVLQTGEADYGWNLQVPAAVLNPLASNPASKGEMVVAPSSSVERILINFADPNTEVNGAKSEPSTKHPFLTDPKVRQALSLAIDRKQIATQLYGPAGVATCNIVVGVPELESKNTKCDPDPEKAKQLLDEAGWKVGADGIREKDGKKLKVVYQTTVNPVRQATQDLVKAAWQKIGVDTELKSVQASVFFSSDAGNPDTAAKFGTDVEMFTNNSSDPAFINYLDGWTTKEITQKSNEWRGSNYHRWSNPEYDALIESIRKELDPAKRKDMIIKANDILVNEIVVIPLVARTQPTSAKVKGLMGPSLNPWSGELYNIADWYKQ